MNRSPKRQPARQPERQSGQQPERQPVGSADPRGPDRRTRPSGTAQRQRTQRPADPAASVPPSRPFYNVPGNGYPRNPAQNGGYPPNGQYQNPPQNGYPQNGTYQNPQQNAGYPPNGTYQNPQQNGYPPNGYYQNPPQNSYPPNGTYQNPPQNAGYPPNGTYRNPPSANTPRTRNGQAQNSRNRNQSGNRRIRNGGDSSLKSREPEVFKRERARAEMEKTLQAQRKAEARAQRKNGLRAVGRFAVYLLCAVLLLAVLAGGGILIALHHTPSAPVSTGNISFYYGGTKVRTEAASRCVDEDELYVCFNDLADYLGMKESGSAKAMKFILRDGDTLPADSSGDGTEESVVFYTDEHRVVINGQMELLDVPNLLFGEEIWVSTDFLTEWMENLSVTYKPGQRTVKVARILVEKKEGEEQDDNTPEYLPISFRLKKSEPLASIEEDPGIGLLADSLREATAYDLSFQTDLEEFESYMNPQGDMRDAFLILVNADHPLTAADVPRDLSDVIYTSSARSTQQLREYPAKALEALFKEMHHYGYYNMAVYSGYRSYDYQDTVFEQYVANEMASNPSLTREDAEALVLNYTPRPGTNEHQTGLAVDMDTMGSFTTDFAWTTEYYWLQENAWKFGFILRFPSDKTGVTGMSFEPWHYRYVGRYHAKIMHDNGLCLEEYIARISN